MEQLVNKDMFFGKLGDKTPKKQLAVKDRAISEEIKISTNKVSTLPSNQVLVRKHLISWPGGWLGQSIVIHL